jgi:hypothetical protein
MVTFAGTPFKAQFPFRLLGGDSIAPVAAAVFFFCTRTRARESDEHGIHD